MKTKSYRAASLREALLQIKQELGEDALVLETKQVRAGGLFGVGARDLIEVRVAPSSKPPVKAAGATKVRLGSIKKLSLRDDSSATPALAEVESAVTSSATFAALAARTYANQTPETTKTGLELPLPPPPAPPIPATPATRVQGVELAETAPRIVHRHSSQRSPVNDRECGTVGPGPASAQRHGSNHELLRLRAELREVKFSIEAFASRSAVREEMRTFAAGPLGQASLAGLTDPATYNSIQYETYLELTAVGLAPALAHQAIQRVTIPETQEPRDFKTLIREMLVEMLPEWVPFAEAPLAANAMAAFIGPTGVGKTTTIAKLAARIALRARRRVELITLDTYRIAAVEQLKTYAEIIGAGCHVARSVVELDALTQRFAGEATLLIDTTGRSPHDLADQLDLADYLRGNETLLKCLVLPATTHPADAQLATNKFALYGANRLVLTKLDETVQPGAAVGVAAEADLPLIYLSAGQRVPEDLERATASTFANHVVRKEV